jgi:asparagine synthase (glutamine-hydrolysing)
LAVDLDRLMRCQGEPFGSTSIYAQNRVFRAAGEAGIKVMLDGQGADELMGGYLQYQGARMATMLSQGRFSDALAFYRAQKTWPGRGARTVLITALGQMLPDALRPYARAMVGRTDRPTWANLSWFTDHNVTLDCAWHHPRRGEHLRGDLQESVRVGLLSLLRYEDRNSMAYSVESRVPFLTTDFAELLLSLPEEHLIGPDGTSKRVFREALRGIVPDAILDRRDKIGFATPEHVWLRRHSEFVDDGLRLSGDAACLDAEGVKRYVRSALGGELPFSFQPWRLLNFAHWNARLAAGRG